MGRPPRITEPGVSYHLLNHRVMRLMVFEKWVVDLNRPMDDGALKLVRQSAMRGMPSGADGWKARIAARLGLETTLRPRGRPRKQHDQREKIILTPFMIQGPPLTATPRRHPVILPRKASTNQSTTTTTAAQE